MQINILNFTDEQRRVLINLELHYDTWIEAVRAEAALPYDLKWKHVSGADYLYEVRDRDGNGRSLGRRSPGTEARWTEYRASAAMAKERVATARARLAETCALYRTLRLPLLSSEAAGILREADRRRLLGHSLLIVGTNAMAVYAIEAGGFLIGAPDETQDFDMAWIGEEADDLAAPVWAMLKAVDPTFTVNSERPFQARNARAYEVEILVAPSKVATIPRRDRPRPAPLPEQEWLLNGRPVSHVVVARDGSPARVVAPDPRWFALQKAWMSAQAKRNPLKRPKDAAQARVLLDAVASRMPQFPLDVAFEATLPLELVEHFAAWKSARPPSPTGTPDW